MDTADEKARELLPCLSRVKQECPPDSIVPCAVCRLRPAVAATLREREVARDALAAALVTSIRTLRPDLQDEYAEILDAHAPGWREK